MNIPVNTGLNDLSRAIKFFESIPESDRTEEDKAQLANLKAAKDKALKGKVREMTDQVIKDFVNRME